MAFINHKRNPVHRSLGRPLATIGRIIAACGWIFVGNLNMATYVGIAACVILLSHVVFGEKP